VIWRPERGTPDDGSMPLAVLLTIVAMALSAMLASMLRSEILLTRADTQRLQALSAAQAGLDVTMAHILAAHDAAGSFVLADLPCAPIHGTAGTGGSGSGAYTASISYFDTDPHGHNDAFLATGTACAGGGTRYALMTVIGDDGAGGTSRTLTATYAFPVAGVPNPLPNSYRSRLRDLGER
jgi:hypothetical protein